MNPFDDPEARFLVLRNDEGQYSLWPSAVEVPAGWSVTLPEGSRTEALAHIEQHWRDLRPLSLIAAMESAGVSR